MVHPLHTAVQLHPLHAHDRRHDPRRAGVAWLVLLIPATATPACTGLDICEPSARMDLDICEPSARIGLDARPPPAQSPRTRADAPRSLPPDHPPDTPTRILTATHTRPRPRLHLHLHTRHERAAALCTPPPAGSRSGHPTRIAAGVPRRGARRSASCARAAERSASSHDFGSSADGESSDGALRSESSDGALRSASDARRSAPPSMLATWRGRG